MEVEWRRTSDHFILVQEKSPECDDKRQLQTHQYCSSPHPINSAYHYPYQLHSGVTPSMDGLMNREGVRDSESSFGTSAQTIGCQCIAKGLQRCKLTSSESYAHPTRICLHQQHIAVHKAESIYKHIKAAMPAMHDELQD